MYKFLASVCHFQRDRQFSTFLPPTDPQGAPKQRKTCDLTKINVTIKEIILKFKETGDSRYIHEKELDVACFQHDMTYGCFKDLHEDC